jgi:c-di-GMP-binding flagellar brake protein YcgR
MNDRQRILVRASEITVGMPLPWAVYDQDGTLMLNAGVPLSQHQVESLLARGAYRKPGSHAVTRSARGDPQVFGIGPHDSEIARRPKPEGDPIPFDDLALQPGELLQVHSALEVVGDFLPVVLIGYLKHQTIITTAPAVNGKPVAVKEGTPYNVKAFSGTHLFTFRTKVTHAYLQPVAHLHLEYPKLVHAIKIRKSMRAIVNLAAELRDAASGSTFPVVIKDLSVGGAKLVLPQPVGEVEARLSLGFKLKVAEDMEEAVQAEVLVRALESNEAKGQVAHTMGVQFLDLPKDVRLAVMTLVYRQQLGRA